MADPQGVDLRAVRQVDWRFLLPDPEVRRVALVGSAAARYADGLAADGVEVVRVEDPGDLGDGPLDALAAPANPALLEALARRRPGVAIYSELAPRALAARGWGPLLRQGATHLAVPSHDRRRAFVALGERRALRWFVTAELERAPLVELSRRGVGSGPVTRAVAARLAPFRAVVLGAPARRQAVAGWLADSGLLDSGAEVSHLLLTPRYSTSRHVVALAGRDEPEVVVKVARLAASPVDAEAAALRALWTATGGRDIGAPRLLAAERWGRRTLLAETAVAGSVLGPREVARDPARTAHALASWTLQLPVREAVPAGGRLATLVHGPLGRLAATGAVEPGLIDATRTMVDRLAPVALPVVFEHGDVSAPNVVRTASGLALVDWELAEPSGLPAHDLFVALGFVARASLGDDPGAALRRGFIDAPPPWAREAVVRYRAALDLPPGALAALFVCCWARVAAALAERAAVDGARAGWLRAQPATGLWRAALERPDALGWLG